MSEKRKRDLEKIYDKPIKDCMLKTIEFIESNKLEKASKKIYEALGAFKFFMFGFFSDVRVTDIKFKKMEIDIDFPNLLADLAFKIILGGDESALRLLMRIQSTLRATPDGHVHSISKYWFPKLKNKNDAWEHYDEVLRIILTYQDRIPRLKWRE